MKMDIPGRVTDITALKPSNGYGDSSLFVVCWKDASGWKLSSWNSRQDVNFHERRIASFGAVSIHDSFRAYALPDRLIGANT